MGKYYSKQNRGAAFTRLCHESLTAQFNERAGIILEEVELCKGSVKNEIKVRLQGLHRQSRSLSKCYSK